MKMLIREDRGQETDMSDRLTNPLTSRREKILASLVTKASRYQLTTPILVRVDLLLERGFVHIARADSEAERSGLLLCLARDVLSHGDGRVDATTLLEERANGAARALGSDEYDVDVLWGYDLSILLVHDEETVRAVESCP